MDTTRQFAQPLAPLAFNLSIRSEGAVPALGRNYLQPAQLVLYPVMAGGIAACLFATVLYTFLPAWLCVLLAIWPGIKAYQLAKPYFADIMSSGRVRANHAILASALESQNAGTFADVVESIVNSQYGNQKWVGKVQKLRGAGGDPYQYLATVFTHAPELWQAGAQRVYEKHLVSVAPNPQTNRE